MSAKLDKDCTVTEERAYVHSFCDLPRTFKPFYFQILSNHPAVERDCLLEIIKLCWKEPQREVQHFAMDTANKYSKVLAGEDVDTCLEALETAKFMLTKKSWWDTVDLIASHSESLPLRTRDVLFFSFSHPFAKNMCFGTGFLQFC